MGNRTKRPAHRPRSKAAGPFARWIASTGKTYPEVAKLLGCSPQAIANFRQGRHKPGRELANKIAQVSGGACPAASWDRPR